MTIRSAVLAYLIIAAMPTSAALAETPREILLQAAFQVGDKAASLARIAEADRAAQQLILRDRGDRDAAFVRAMALGYRAKLIRNRGDALAARAQFEALLAADPRDAEAAAAVGTWHLDSILDLGGFVAGMALGAKKQTGFDMMDRAVRLGGNRATYPGLAALLRLAIDPADERGRALAEAASGAATPYPLDRIMQRSAAALLAPLKARDRAAVQRIARQSLPFGRVAR